MSDRNLDVVYRNRPEAFRRDLLEAERLRGKEPELHGMTLAEVLRLMQGSQD